MIFLYNRKVFLYGKMNLEIMSEIRNLKMIVKQTPIKS